MSLETWKKIIKKDYQERLRSELRYESVRQIKHQYKTTGYNHQQLKSLADLFYQEYTYDKEGTPYSDEKLRDIIEDGISHRGRIVILSKFFVLKLPDEEDEGYDAIFQEVAVGLQANKLRTACPNFVYTFGICKTDPPNSLRRGYRRQNYHCAVIEHINGESFSRTVEKKSFREHYDIYLQIWLALAFAQSQIGLTHYDLHTGNVIIVNLSEPTNIEYPWGTLRTTKLVKIIDWGRSFAYGEYKGKKVSIGKPYPRLGIQMGPNYFYDCYHIIKRSMTKLKNPELEPFLKFFGVETNFSDHKDLLEVARKPYEWKKWHDLIVNHPFAQSCFKVRPVELPDPLHFPRLELPKDYTFKELERYLSDWRATDYTLAREQLEKEQTRLEKLREMRKALQGQNPLPVKLEKINLNNYTQEAQEKILAVLNNIVIENPTRYLSEHLDYYIETIIQRVDFLNQLINFQIKT